MLNGVSGYPNRVNFGAVVKIGDRAQVIHDRTCKVYAVVEYSPWHKELTTQTLSLNGRPVLSETQTFQNEKQARIELDRISNSIDQQLNVKKED